MVLVDTSVWIDYFNGKSSPETDRRARMLMDSLPCADLVGRDVAVVAAQHYRLRRKGVKVRKTIDVLIATFCIVNEHSLLHTDKDFTAFERHLGLEVLDP